MQKKIFCLFLALSTVFMLFSNSTVSEAYNLEELKQTISYEYYRPYVVKGEGADYWAYKDALRCGDIEDAQKYYRDWFPQYEEEYEFLKADDGTVLVGMECKSGNYVPIPKDSICAKRIINGEIGDKSRLGELDMAGDFIFYPGLGVPDSVPVTYESTPITDTTSEVQQNQIAPSSETGVVQQPSQVANETNSDVVNGEGYSITLKSKGATVKFDAKNNYSVKVEGVGFQYYQLYSIAGDTINISHLIPNLQYSITVGVNPNYEGTQWKAPITITAK